MKTFKTKVGLVPLCRPLAGVMLCALMSVLPVANAANWAWSTSPGTANWNANNWTSGTTPGTGTGAPASGDNLYFGTSSQLNLNNDLSSFSFGGITFNSGANAFTFTGNAFTLNGGITNNSSSLEAITNNIALGAATMVTNTAAGKIYLGGVISGANSLTLAGTGTDTLAGANTYSGATTLGGSANDQITVILGNKNAFGGGAVSTETLNGPGSVTLQAATDLSGANAITNKFTLNVASGSTSSSFNILGANNLTLAGAFTAGYNMYFSNGLTGGATLTLSSNVTVSGRNINFNGSGNTTISGNIVAVNGLYFNGTGITTIGGTNGNSTGSGYSLFRMGSTGPVVLGTTQSVGNNTTLLEFWTSTPVLQAAADLSAGINIASVLFNAKATFSGANNMTFNCGITNNHASGSTLTNNISSGKTLAFTGTFYLSDAGYSGNTLTFVIAGTGNTTFGGPIVNGSAATASLIISNTGITTMSGANTYNGSTTVAGGTLALAGSGSLAYSPSIVVASNAVFDVSGLTGSASPFVWSSTVSQTLSNIAPGAVISGTNDCSMGTLALTYDGVNPAFTITNGGMKLSPSTVINIKNTGAALAGGTYRVIAKAATGNAGLVAGTLPASYTVSGNYAVGGGGAAGRASLQIINGELDLVVTVVTASTPPDVWTGNADYTSWDTTTLNWQTGGLATNYYNGDPVLFDDTANPSATSVSISSTVSPYSMVVSNNALNYTFSGSAIAGGGALVKKGTGMLTMSTSSKNTFTGGVLVSGGTFLVGNANQAFGAYSNVVVVTNGGTIDFSGYSYASQSQFVVSGTGVGGLGALVNNGTGFQFIVTNVALTADTTVGGTGRLDMNYSGNHGGVLLDLRGHTLTVSGPGTNQFSVFSGLITAGNINLTAGTLCLRQSTVWTNAGSQITLGSGTSLWAPNNGGQLNITVPIYANGAYISPNNMSTDDGADYYSPIILGANTTNTLAAGTAANTVRQWAPISGSGTFIVGGAGPVFLFATNTYTASTIVTNGTLALTNNGSINNTPQISLWGGGTLDVSGLASSTFTLSASTALEAEGAGGTNMAVINGAVGGTVNLGSQPISLAYDGTDPALIVSNATLHLNGNAFTVNGAVLANGTYVIAQQASGNISSSGSYPAVTGTAIGVGQTGAISVSGGNVNLVVSSAPSVAPAFPANAVSVAGGTVSLTVTGAVGAPFSLWATTNLALSPITNTWIKLTNGTVSASPFTITDPGATTNQQRFYIFSSP